MLWNLQLEAIFLREQLKLKHDHFRDEISYLRKQLEEYLHLIWLKRDDHDFVSYREILNLSLKKSITITDEPPRDLNSINSIKAFKNYFKKTREIHRHNTRHTSKDTVEIPQPITETYGRYSIRFQAATTWNNMQNALQINMLSSYNEAKKNLTNYFYENLQ